MQAQVRRGGSPFSFVNRVPKLFANYLLAYVGIVPVLSLLKQHVRQMLHFSPNLYLEGLEYREENIQNVELAMEERKGSLLTKVASSCLPKRTPNTTRKDMSESIREHISLHDTLNS